MLSLSMRRVSCKREIKAFSKVADKIDAMEPKFEAMTNKELKNIKDETNAINSLIFCFLLLYSIFVYCEYG